MVFIFGCIKMDGQRTKLVCEGENKNDRWNVEEITLVYKQNKEKNIKGETSFTGHVLLNGQRFRFWNLSYDSMTKYFESTVKWFLCKSDMEEKRGIGKFGKMKYVDVAFEKLIENDRDR